MVEALMRMSFTRADVDWRSETSLFEASRAERSCCKSMYVAWDAFLLIPILFSFLCLHHNCSNLAAVVISNFFAFSRSAE